MAICVRAQRNSDSNEKSHKLFTVRYYAIKTLRMLDLYVTDSLFLYVCIVKKLTSFLLYWTTNLTADFVRFVKYYIVRLLTANTTIFVIDWY